MTSGKISIGIVTANPVSRSGNAVTARRWQTLLRELGHRVALVGNDHDAAEFDLLIALHARRAAPALESFSGRFPDRPSVLALTGTDLYGDLARDPIALRSLELADRHVILQPLGIRQLPQRFRDRAVTIYQSSAPRRAVATIDAGSFDICQLAHLRQVKDPLRAAAAVRQIPASSRIRLFHAGATIDPELEAQARQEAQSNPRYEWLGELDREEALERMAASRLLVLTSKLEGGANVVTEAIAAGVPVVSTRIDGSVGILGERYPAYFPAGDTRALADLLHRLEANPTLYEELRDWVARLRPLTDPRLELRSWRRLLGELLPA